MSTMVIYGPDDQIYGVITPKRNPNQGKCLWDVNLVDGGTIGIGPFSKWRDVWSAFTDLVEDGQIVLP